MARHLLAAIDKAKRAKTRADCRHAGGGGGGGGGEKKNKKKKKNNKKKKKKKTNKQKQTQKNTKNTKKQKKKKHKKKQRRPVGAIGILVAAMATSARNFFERCTPVRPRRARASIGDQRGRTTARTVLCVCCPRGTRGEGGRAAHVRWRRKDMGMPSEGRQTPLSRKHCSTKTSLDRVAADHPKTRWSSCVRTRPPIWRACSRLAPHGIPPSALPGLRFG